MLLVGATVMICNYEDSLHTKIKQVAWRSHVLANRLSTRAICAILQKSSSAKNATMTSKRSHPRPMRNSKQRIIHHMGIMPIPPPPDPPPDPPRLAGPPPKLLPLLLPLIDLLFVTPAEACPLPVLPDAFLFFFDPPRKLPRPLLPPRLFELS